MSHAITAPEARMRTGLSTGELLCWTIALFTLVSLGSAVQLWRSGNPSGASAFSAIEVIARCVALWLVLSDPLRSRPASSGHIAYTILLGVVAVAAPGRSATLALIPLAIMILRSAGWSEHQRRAAVILLAIGGQRLVANVVPVLFGDAILRLDTAAAGLLMQLFIPGTLVEANTLKPPGEVGVTVFMACSSFANLSLVLLCFTTFHALDGGRATPRAAAVLALTCLGIIILNTVRLVATALSLDSYLYWHNGPGAEIFGIVMTLATVIACSLGSRWALNCR